MGIKSCAYRNCKNYSINNLPHGQYTMFQFPKDPERRKKWMELGCVDKLLPLNHLIMCSEHFEWKYISKNARRCALLGNAVPIPYKRKNIVAADDDENDDDDDDDDNDDDIDGNVTSTLEYVLPVEEKFLYDNVMTTQILKDGVDDDEKYKIETIDPIKAKNESYLEFDGEQINAECIDDIIQDDEINMNCIEMLVDTELHTNQLPIKREDNLRYGYLEEVEENLHLHVQPGHGTYLNRKRQRDQIKLESTTVEEFPYDESTKQMQLTDMLTFEAIEDDADGDVDNVIDKNDLINSTKITTFIYKDEEYVQMPKEYYIKEKSNLMKQLHDYAQQLKTLKSSIKELHDLANT